MSDFVTFISLRGVTNAAALGTLVHLMTQHGRLRLADVLTGSPHAPVGDREFGIGAANDWLTIIAPEPFETLAADLSRLLGAPAFMFQLHEGGSWLYWLFVNGRQVDHFDSEPALWEDSSTAEMMESVGDPRALAAELGGDAADLAPYLTRSEAWPPDQGDEYDVVDRAMELLDKDARVHPGDRFDVWDARVMYDFMRRLGIEPPLNPDGKVSEPLTLIRFEPTP
ncbi:MAG: hypothetical protein KIS91_15995 [Anaerolineae bacterium]|nr:hypothetical protein [Anaerolineae bacterium]